MSQRIIYPIESGRIAVVVPSEELSVLEVAQKDVPAGTPYLIVDVASIPTDRTFRDAWAADFSAPDGYGIGAEAWHSQRGLSND
jgi:hypothetical protein